MKIVGLTGGIASGKNFVAEIFQKNGAMIFDADAEVHKLLESDKSTFEYIIKEFPQAVIDQEIDRKILGKIVFSDIEKLKILEAILHPKVREKYQDFLKESQKNNAKLVVLNVPLLLESDGYKCDKIVAIIAADEVRKQRFIKRSKSDDINNLEEKFAQIKAQQIDDYQRKEKADFVIDNSGLESETIKQVEEIISTLQK